MTLPRRSKRHREDESSDSDVAESIEESLSEDLTKSATCYQCKSVTKNKTAGFLFILSLSHYHTHMLI